MSTSGSVASMKQAPAPGERRRHFRHTCALDRRGFVCTDGERYPWPVHLHNISREGVSLRLGCGLTPGADVRLYIHNVREDTTVHLSARVIWGVGFPGGEHVLGCRFQRELSDQELQQLL
jgi:hypothetical protein